MIRLAVYRVRPDKLDRLKAWLIEVAQRPEVLDGVVETTVLLDFRD